MADVQLPGGSGHHGLSRRGGLFGNVKAGGKIIGAALGKIPQRRPLLQLHQAGDDLVQRTVSAHGHHGVVVRTLTGGDGGGLAGGVGVPDGQ